jgi:hypothetical protein
VYHYLVAIVVNECFQQHPLVMLSMQTAMLAVVVLVGPWINAIVLELGQIALFSLKCRIEPHLSYP